MNEKNTGRFTKKNKVEHIRKLLNFYNKANIKDITTIF